MAKRRTAPPATPVEKDTPGYRFTRDVTVGGLRFTAGRSVLEGEIPAGKLSSLLGVGWLVPIHGDAPDEDPAGEQGDPGE